MMMIIFQTAAKCSKREKKQHSGYGTDCFSSSPSCSSDWNNKKKDPLPISSGTGPDNTNKFNMVNKILKEQEILTTGFSDYRSRKRAIMEILVDCNLASYAKEFRNIVDIEHAKKLTHTDLRAKGLQFYEERDRLMTAFMEYKLNKKGSRSDTRRNKAR